MSFRNPWRRESASNGGGRRLPVLVGAALLCLGVIVAFWAGNTDERPAAGARYCSSLRDPERSVALVEGALIGKPVAPTLTLEGLRGIAAMTFSPDVAAEALPQDRAEAELVLRGLRSALQDSSRAPLETAAFTDAVAELERRGPIACPK